MSHEKLKKLFANYPTGVTVVTSCVAGKIKAITVNSYTSLSLDPPLVMFNLGNKSSSLEAIKNTNYFAVNILAANQENVARDCARASEDKLQHIPYRLNQYQVPLIHNALAHIECKKERLIAVGDHHIVVGLVEKYDYESSLKPLYYHNSNFFNV